MKKSITKLLFAAAICVASMTTSQQSSAQGIIYSDDEVFIEDFEIAPGETKLVTVWMTSTYSWHFMWSIFEMPKGLEFEVLTPEDIDPKDFSLEAVYDINTLQPMPEDQCMTALSTDFADSEQNYNCYLYFRSDPIVDAVNEDGTPYPYNGSVILNIVCEDNMTFDGTYKVALFKVRATDELENESFIKFHETYFMSPSNHPISGVTADSQVFATPTQTRVMRTAGTNAITDINSVAIGDGAYYDLQGRRVAEPTQPGIYIHDGKKVIIN